MRNLLGSIPRQIQSQPHAGLSGLYDPILDLTVHMAQEINVGHELGSRFQDFRTRRRPRRALDQARVEIGEIWTAVVHNAHRTIRRTPDLEFLDQV